MAGVRFTRRVTHRRPIRSDAGLLAYRELYDTLDLTGACCL